MDRRSLLISAGALANFAIAPSQSADLNKKLAPTDAGGPKGLRYLAQEMSSETRFAELFPHAHDVWKNWLCRVPRTKPGAQGEPNAQASSWENLTVDWASLQERLERDDFVQISGGNYITSDTLLRRRSNSLVICAGTIKQTRGGSRGNMLALGEGHDIAWIGGTLDASQALGDNAVTIFQSLITTDAPNWKSTIARRTSISNVSALGARNDKRYGGGKGLSIQYGAEAVAINDFMADDCDIGFSVEGKLSRVPLRGPAPSDSYQASAIALSNVVVTRARLMGAFFANASSTGSPVAMSVIGSGLCFYDCAYADDAAGIICGDRAANIKLMCQVIGGQLPASPNIFRGNFLNSDFDVLVNAGLATSIFDFSHPPAFGSDKAQTANTRFQVKLTARPDIARALFVANDADNTGTLRVTKSRFALEIDDDSMFNQASSAFQKANRISVSRL